jgi:hypothetical protein
MTTSPQPSPEERETFRKCQFFKKLKKQLIPAHTKAPGAWLKYNNNERYYW